MLLFLNISKFKMCIQWYFSQICFSFLHEIYFMIFINEATYHSYLMELLKNHAKI